MQISNISLSVIRYVSLNPVRARLVERAEDWVWSSVRAQVKGEDDGLVTVRPALDRVSRFSDLIAEEPEADRRYAPALQSLRVSEATGRPPGARDFVDDLERALGDRSSQGGEGAGLRPRSPIRPNCSY